MKTKCTENEYLNKEVIRAFLEENAMRQKDLATMLNKSEAQISCYLTHAKPFPRNRADRDLLQQITKIPIDQLLTKKRDHQPRSQKTINEQNQDAYDENPNLHNKLERTEVDQKPDKCEDISKASPIEDALTRNSDIKSFMVFIKAFIVTLISVLCESNFHLFSGVNENPLFHYPLLFLFSACLVSYTGCEVFILEKDSLIYQQTTNIFKASRILTILWLVIGCALNL